MDYALHRERQRSEFIDIVIDQDDQLDDLLEGVVDDFKGLVNSSSSSNHITNEDRIIKATPVILGALFLSYRSLLQDSNKSTAQVSGQREFEIIENLLTRAGGFSDELSKLERRVTQYPNDVYKQILFRQWPGTGKNADIRIRTIEREARNTVYNILEVGMRNGWSAFEIAQRIEDYVRPAPQGKGVSPFDYYRERFGRQTIQKIKKGEVPAGSVSYNAFRIARTEINRTYRLATVELSKDKPWVSGYRWNLSTAHPRPDICDEWAASSPYANHLDLPPGHPNCMCYVTTEFLSLEELRRL